MRAVDPAERTRATGTITPMTNALDMLVIGDRSSRSAEEALQRGGHRIHRCHAPDAAPFPCVGLTDPSECPLTGSIDVTLLIRRGVQPQPLPHEDGVRCALRAGIPVVEDGLDVLDPYAEWISSRVGLSTDVVTECLAAADEREDDLRLQICDRIAALTASVGVDCDDVPCMIRAEADGLRVDLTVPVPIDERLRHAIAVRALDAVRTTGRSYGHVNVDVRGSRA